LNPVHFYVYYKFDPVRIEEVRAVVDALFAEIRSTTGIQGEWQRRRDDPSTFMEIFANVPDADAFGRTLQAALDKVGFTRLGFPRITEIFQCA
jgi:quinol monooxygenase YgiN